MSDSCSYIKPLLELFETSLADVRFADVDGEALTRAVGEVDSAEEELNAAQAVVDAARAKFHDRQETLLQAAHRALAYVRVYAEQDETLATQVSVIALPRPVRRTRSGSDALVLSPDPAPTPRPGARPRGRPRKVAPAGPSLDVLAPMGE